MEVKTLAKEDAEKLRQSAAEKRLFERCASAMEALECGSRETIANEWIGRRTTTRRRIEIGELAIELVTTHTEKNKHTGCLLYSSKETESVLTAKLGGSAVFLCTDHTNQDSDLKPNVWRRIDAYAPGDWEKDIDALLKMIEMESNPATYDRIRKTLKVGIFRIETFDDAIKIMKR